MPLDTDSELRDIFETHGVAATYLDPDGIPAGAPPGGAIGDPFIVKLNENRLRAHGYEAQSVSPATTVSYIRADLEEAKPRGKFTLVDSGRELEVDSVVRHNRTWGTVLVADE